jgi:hypothetical protein
MKYLSTLTLFLLFGFSVTIPDAGSCVKYDVVIESLNGKQIKGFVYVGGYDRRFHFKDISFLEYLKKNNPSDTFHLYRNIQTLKYPIMEGDSENCTFHFEACVSEDDLIISKKSIKQIKVLSYGVCNNCDVADEENGYYWNGIHPVIITELTRPEIDLLQLKPLAAIKFEHDVTDAYWMISYSTAYAQKELEKFRDKFLMGDKQADMNERYVDMKKELNKNNVIVFKIGYAL